MITSNSQTPSYAWLKFVKTGKAKSHIKRWVKKEQIEQSIRLGKEIIEKTLRRIKRMSILNEIKTNQEYLRLVVKEILRSSSIDRYLLVIKKRVYPCLHFRSFEKL